MIFTEKSSKVQITSNLTYQYTPEGEFTRTTKCRYYVHYVIIYSKLNTFGEIECLYCKFQ